MGYNVEHSSAVAAPAGTCSGTPVRPRFASLPSHLTPVGNWNATNDRSRLSGAGGSPTECLRDYLSGLHGKEEEEEVGFMRCDIVYRARSKGLLLGACWVFFRIFVGAV